MSVPTVRAIFRLECVKAIKNPSIEQAFLLILGVCLNCVHSKPQMNTNNVPTHNAGLPLHSF